MPTACVSSTNTSADRSWRRRSRRASRPWPRPPAPPRRSYAPAAKRRINGPRAGAEDYSWDASIERLQRDGLPIGWGYRPHCLLFEAGAGGGCRGDQQPSPGPLSLAGSILALLGTGVLIGLGAPFWFDLARRLAEFRGLFSARAGGESAARRVSPAGGDPRQAGPVARDGLIERVVDEALAD